MNNKLKKEIEDYIENKNFTSAKSALVSSLKADIDKYQTRLVQSSDKNKTDEQPKPLCLAHYTSVETIYSILDKHDKDAKEKPSESCLRLYDAFYLNDPNEGKYLKDKLAEHYEWSKEIEQDTDAFVCSFVGSDDYEKKVEDKLTYWQSYGKDGLGCSILLPPIFPYEKILHPVLYGKKNVKDVKDKFQDYLELGGKLYAEYADKEEQQKFAAEFWKGFDNIKFIYKDDAYKDEYEYRVIKIPKENKKIGYDLKSGGPYLRRYILDESLNASNILSSGSKVVIGPAVRKANHLAQNLEAFAKEKGLYGPKFSSSDIPYQKFW